ncbi:MAG: tRNA (adenosine(37)-N6)-dimethylallyltransferase MiaA [Lentimicrobiaceae bacterium]|nr:tRNA (adenosine(37)-N6)-dimethylallyltransferase MiaA [Lentimicrobiaceae bacterium]MCL2132494.1 tRNA (adenosine(37)-N6)-dimethylallyltransferase MiaA [Lentimicrobiaceae bacterium]
MATKGNPLLLCILGPTACGKTHLAAKLAHILNGEVISADSRQVYREMTIGTGKDLNEYVIDGQSIPYHLIDIVNTGHKYNIYEYQRDFKKVYKDIAKRDKMPILCGGSGLYIESVLGNYRLDYVPYNRALRQKCLPLSMEELTEMLQQKKKLHNTSDTTDRERLIRALEIAVYNEEYPHIAAKFSPNYKLFYVNAEREVLRERIAVRLRKRLEDGMVEEVKSLMDAGFKVHYYGLEYRYISDYLNGMMTYEEMTGQLEIAIGQFAKRQQTWFNRMKKIGFELIDIDESMSDDEKIRFILQSA